MSEEKQIEKQAIEEMAKFLWKNTLIHTEDLCHDVAETLVIEGYRKQSEGEWVDEPNFAQKGIKGKYYVCSNCNVCVPAIEELPLYQWEYCPCCGAKMKGGAE